MVSVEYLDPKLISLNLPSVNLHAGKILTVQLKYSSLRRSGFTQTSICGAYLIMAAALLVVNLPSNIPFPTINQPLGFYPPLSKLPSSSKTT
jgi:hypothetical protein